MPNILQDIEGWFAPEEKAFAAFLHTVMGDITAWAKKEEVVIVADLQVWWGANKAIFGTYSASQLVILKGLVATAAADAAAGDYSAIVNGVLAQAETQELAWVISLTTAELASIVAFLANSKVPVSPPAPPPPAAA
jgi:hypothetical protein